MPSADTIISIAAVSDAPALTELGIKTFCDSFGPYNRKEDMDKYIATQMNLQRITDELHDAGNIFFLARHAGMLAGYAKVRCREIPEELKEKKPLEIERIYVLHSHHGKKIGAALMQQCIGYARSNGHDVIWLGVWERNELAVNFYKQWGFTLFGAHPFLLGDDHQTDVLMKKELD